MSLKIKKNVSLAPLSTFGIGGKAEYFVTVKNGGEIEKAIIWAKEKGLDYKIIAGGSNVLFPDGKLRGLLIQIKGGGINVVAKEKIITADAGVPLAEVVKQANKAGLAGVETLAGIPGTLGGAVVGNAGAYGHSISEVVEEVKVFNPLTRKWIVFSKSECKFDYRESIFKSQPLVVAEIRLRFRKRKTNELKKISREIIKTRKKKYKPGLKCPGSFFKNVLVKDLTAASLSKVDKSKIIEGKVPAGYLLEAVGAKGMRVGGVEVSDFHGNIFINKDGGTAKDVKKLARILKKRVEKKFGIKLEEEIRYIDE